MPNYKQMYFDLAGKVADVIDILVEAQREGEESYSSEEAQPPIVLAEEE
ncbi:hypothetical protein LJC49_09115 [Ruminococcaceae bacterium OttesenSCG-928-I18]|nr:hypothetical protein [Ruminococcaceae bacterium OttesenSCG-928-I18]